MAAAGFEACRERRRKVRLARFLLAGPATVRESAGPGTLLAENAERGTLSVSPAALDGMAREGLVRREGTKLALTEEGVAFARREAAAHDPYLAQHAQLASRTVETAAGRTDVTANLCESPLLKLARRRNRKGEAFLTRAEFAAGERLRADFTRGRMMPRMGANWQAAVASGRRDGGAGGVADLTDAALAARQRVDRALSAVGPELAGILVDICCFLKGLELVESERGWPVRSAKVVLKTALAALARHYGPARARKTTDGAAIRHWGAAGYRPTARPG